MSATCEARTGYYASDHGFRPLWCHQWKGLRSFEDATGQTRSYCAAPGHRENVASRFGLAPVEPHDAVAAAKARADLERGTAHFNASGRLLRAVTDNAIERDREYVVFRGVEVEVTS